MSHWEKPGFEVLMVAGECTAYSGALAVGLRPVVGAGTGTGTVGASSRPANPPLGGPLAEAKGTAVL